MIKPTVMVVSMSIFAVGTVGGTWSLIFDDLDDMIKRIIKVSYKNGHMSIRFKNYVAIEATNKLDEYTLLKKLIPRINSYPI
jgi:hypothetical protein